MDPLASFAELQTYMPGVDLDQAQAEQLLEIASATIRTFIGQSLSLVEDDELTLDAYGWTDVWLPERPVVEVASVTVDGVLADPSTWSLRTGGHLVFPSGIGAYADHGYYVYEGDREAVIVYSHGWTPEEMPWDIKGNALALAKQGIVVSQGDSEGIKSETVGPDSITYDTEAAGNLTAAMERSLEPYRRSTTSVAISS